jgi:hypothetical protein
MDTLPRFRLPDESSSRDIAKVSASGAWSEFDDLDKVETRVLVREGRHVVLRRPLRSGGNTDVDDVVQELRAAAAGRSSPVRELTSNDLLDDIPDADAAQEVDISELVFDRVVERRDVWNVREAARAPQGSIVGPTLVSNQRFLWTAAIAMVIGAALAVVVALVVWRLAIL